MAEKLFAAIGLVPPDAGEFNIGDLNKKLAGLTIETRARVKGYLVDCGLLSPGRQVNYFPSA
jgi:hypothetical protein